MTTYFNAYKGCFILITISILVLSVSGCTKTGETPPAEKSINSVELVDKKFIKDSYGLPVSVRLVADVTIQGGRNTNVSYSCKLAYDNEILEKGVDREEVIGENEEALSRVTLISPVEGKLDIAKWSVCCDILSSALFNAKTNSTVCVQEGGGS